MHPSKPRILLSANACRPDMGSEPMVGWSAYQALKQQYSVRVLCAASGKAAILKAEEAGQAQAEDFHFIPERWRYTGRPVFDKLINWLNILDFQQRLATTGQREVERFQPDVIHQVTIATWRVGNPLAGRGRPFVWGPLGGGEELPPGFWKIFSPFSRIFEWLRKGSGFLARHQPGVIQTARKADWIFAGNHPTASLVTRLRGHSEQTEILPVVAFSEEKLGEFLPRSPIRERETKTIEIFSGGYVEARKGMGLALQALAVLKARGFLFHYEHGGIGPETTHLRAEIKRLGLEECVRLVQPYGGAAYREKLRSAEIFLFPSLRDNCPISLLEAMGHGCVPVVADHAGPGEIVTEDCGIKIPTHQPDDFVHQLADQLENLFRDGNRRQKLGAAARDRVLHEYSRSRWFARVSHAYQEVCSGSRRRSKL